MRRRCGWAGLLRRLPRQTRGANGWFAPTLATADASKVRMGGFARRSPRPMPRRVGWVAFVADARHSRRVEGADGRVSPTLATADASKVRMGGFAPTVNPR